MITEIYAITDDAGIPKYVGRTTSGLARRLNGHACAKNEIGAWIRSNRESVRIRLLEGFSDEFPENGNRERYWIKRFREEGHALFNKWPMPRKYENALSELEKEQAE